MVRSLFLPIAGCLIAACTTPDVEQPPEQPSALVKQHAMGTTDAYALVSDDVAWDHFNHRGMHIWGCRKILSGEYVTDSFCYGKPRNDLQWPGMAVPPGYRGLLLE